MKTCFICGKKKALEEFYPHKKMRDGRLNKCKECTKSQEEARRIENMKNPEWVLQEMDRQREKERRRREQGKVRKETLEESRVRLLRYRGGDAVRKKAHHITSAAIRDGKLKKKPCEVCGHPLVQAHHDDYSKPLEVRWLCVQHHNEHHIQERRKKVLERFQNSNGSQQPLSKPKS